MSDKLGNIRVRQGGAKFSTSTEKKKSRIFFFFPFSCTDIFLFQLRVLVLVGFCGYCGAGVSFGVSIRIAWMGVSGWWLLGVRSRVFGSLWMLLGGVKVTR